MIVILQLLMNFVLKFVRNKSFSVPESSGDVHISRYDLYKTLYEEKYAAWDDSGVNICGFRDESGLSEGVWNDVLVLCYKDDSGKGVVEEFTGTTDPGAHATQVTKEWENCTKDVSGVSRKSSGAAHLCPGFYSSWKYGKHQGYPALVQTVNSVKVWADFNSTNPLIWKKPENIRDGYCGINIHYGVGSNNRVWLASIGCQVIRGLDQWKRFISIIEKFEKKAPGRIYSYLLTYMEDYPRRDA